MPGCTALVPEVRREPQEVMMAGQPHLARFWRSSSFMTYGDANTLGRGTIHFSRAVILRTQQLNLQREICRDLKNFERLMSTDSLPIKNLMYIIYGILMDRDLKTPLAYQRAWEMDLGRSISPAAWNSLWNSALYTSTNINVSMLTYKILYRWHLIPHKLHKINCTISLNI